MIVKNESKIITRLFDSVLPLIDAYCICDTGSTDNTVAIIREYFGTRGIQGKILEEPFQDFAHNRTVALQACADMIPQVDYLLLLDADMILRIPDKSPVAIEAIRAKIAAHPAHYIFQGCDKFFYKNVRLVRNNYSSGYRSVTHEYIEMPSGTTYGLFDRTELFIDDVGDGGAKADKFERDVRLLLGGLEREPKNERYHFYLASSYRDGGQLDKAIEYYKKRTELGGWFEEIWYSFYAIGNCYERMGNMESAVYYWMMAYTVIQNRLENLYKVINHYRNLGKNELAYMYYRLADTKRATLPATVDFLFLENDVYDYKLDYEFSIIGYYCNHDHYDLTKVCMRLFANPMVDEPTYRNILSNYKFYSPKLANFATKQLAFPIENIPQDFAASTPSIVAHKGEVWVNVRLVNYGIDDNGGYVQRDTIATENRLYRFSTISNMLASLEASTPTAAAFHKTLANNTILDNVYIGTEDVRLFSHHGCLLYNGNRGLGYNTIVVEHGDVIAGTSTLLTLENKQESVEKNWTLFEDARGALKCVYHWWPLQIGDIDIANSKLSIHPHPVYSQMRTSECGYIPSSMGTACSTPYRMEITHRAESTPACLKHARGSTNGVRVRGEIWFICHVVSYEDRRFYYHILVALDPTTYEVRRYSRLFSFEGEKVEYTLGFVYEEVTDRLVIGYSTMDRTTKFMTVARDIIESAVFL